MRWEKLIKLRARGLTGRVIAFRLISKGLCPKAKSKKHYEVPKALVFIEEIYDQFAD